jgi:uncharacterized protein (DUF2235 family)
MALYAFDGTGQNFGDTGTDWAAVAAQTNIHRFFSAYQGYAAPGVTCDYVPGVGTRFGFAGKVFGDAWGAGWLPRIDTAYRHVCGSYEAGDRIIDVIGFSRGAAIALDFVNKVAKEGIVCNGTVVDPNPEIRFVGLFDVVAAFGVANLGLVFAEFNPLHQLRLPDNVKHCYHAMALDERRANFENTRVDGAYEVWFRGAHSDIGGGNDNPDLEYVALRWMYRKAILCQLPVTEANITDSAVHPERRIEPSRLSKASLFWRTVKSSDRVHYAVAQHPPLPGEALNQYPGGCFIETLEDEKTRTDRPDVAVA